jgi:cysteinyl-tRNA synthetase
MRDRVVIYDVLYRILCFTYGKDKVTYVRNITDVDDKINAKAIDLGITIQELTSNVYQQFQNDVQYLNCLSPTHEPKATEHIQGMIDIIEKLIKKQHAYVKSNHVYFDVTSMDNYGALAGRNLDEMISGVRIEVSEDKENPGDFVLWKPASQKDDKSSIFDSPWGPGRPGWHIECSAMSKAFLGEDFDIHGGGADLIFPHHTNEIAQSLCAFPGSKYAHFSDT